MLGARATRGERSSGLVPDYRRRPDAELALEAARGAWTTEPTMQPSASSPSVVAERQRAAALEIRRLSYPDLPQVIAIERRVFPTPWSLAMFVLELSKPSGICLARGRADGERGSSAT